MPSHQPVRQVVGSSLSKEDQQEAKRIMNYPPLKRSALVVGVSRVIGST